ncbi:MAG: DinB family protein, partial [Bacteroidota bacterium]
METKQLIVKSVLDAWNSRLDSANKLFNALTDEHLQKEVAPGRNRGSYLLGHLAVVHDKMLPLLNFEPALYPDLEEAFLTKPDRAISNVPSIQELRIVWDNV